MISAIFELDQVKQYWTSLHESWFCPSQFAGIQNFKLIAEKLHCLFHC